MKNIHKFWKKVSICCALLLLLTACETRAHSVRYQISGSAKKIAISYINGTGATEQRDVSSGWATTYNVKTWQYVGVTVFNATLDGSVTCRLYVDGVLIQHAESVGGLKWASCGGLAGITGAKSAQ